MKERGWIEPIVERVLGQVLQTNAAQLRTEIVHRVMEEIAAEAATAESTTEASAGHRSASGAEDLARAVAEIQLGSSQREILRAMLDASARYAARVALFVVKGSHASGWQGRGFDNSDAVKDFALDENAAAVVQAIGEHAVASVPVADLDPRFLEKFGAPASGEARILPLILKEKVAALVYADSGTDAEGLLDAGALDLLVLSTSAWLEVNSLRKHAQKETPATPADSHQVDNRYGDSFGVPGAPPSYVAAPTVPAFNDPFASHVPAFVPGHALAAAAAGDFSGPVGHAAVEAPEPIPTPVPSPVPAMAAECAATEVQSAVAAMEPAPVEPTLIGNAETASTPTTPAVAAMSPEDQDVHRKAQRFARLLVDEIKLYNRAKVAEGRENKDLYDRLKEVIEKSQATYQKRYGNTVAASGNYFQNEVIRSLAEDDLSIMGANFRQ